MKILLSKSRLVYAIAILLVLAGCKKSDQLMYKEDPRIYFDNGAVQNVSFAGLPADIVADTLYIPLRIMGTATNKDRTFKLTVDDSSTAKLGYHFSFGPLVIPANTYNINLPVYIYRKPGLKDSLVTAYITIAESADFKIGYKDGIGGTSTYGNLGGLHYQIKITDQLLKPTNWDNYLVNYFGDFSLVKFQFMIQATGVTSWNNYPLPQYLNFRVQTVKFALYNYELANGPLIDEFGNKVTFP